MNNINVSVIIDSFYQNNQLFNENNTQVNRDDCFRPWIELKKSLEQDKIFLNTVDIMPIKDADIILFMNMPTLNDVNFKEALSLKKKIYCVVTELDLIHKPNSNINQMGLFDKIFTYQTNLIDNKKFFKINYSFDFKKQILEFDQSHMVSRSYFSTMIAGNKKLKHDNELYSKRVEIIKWFESNHTNQFDLYGLGWNKRRIFNRYVLNYSNLGFIGKLLSDYYITYKGSVEKKSDVLKKYKFSFCLENAIDTEGWITEKIFDSLFNGCIPIYLGASEIETFIDKSCFVNLRDFESFEELYDFLTNMDKETYNNYLSNIKKFIERKAEDNEYEFGIPYFIKTIKNQIIESNKIN
ncbi:glycosyl transferase family 10 (putative fucosyltransferase) [Flavobacterium araucananum]|uniref:Fucosyltransferase C-terminal domain-containing protein n=1 Tax=Flavobacterium araucananum TaxID=946678 RepID=A0A227PHI0_9FLAO|nr:glycosyltransferase family 10 [Flavobacterium araucananum]OXG08758.1 hypothetical protein B0A64_04855 [Flavobacterium araucananum]PWJ97752.1 glycosyl transferase family 10 (putative fucosyltransferase) [Flavobacterium araucananum]